MYKSAEERFTLAEKAMDTLKTMALDMQDVGCYGRDDEAAFQLLLFNLYKCMKILDPQRMDELVDKVAKEEGMELTKSTEQEGLGQYL